ncbi:cytochrome P450 18a1 [Coccinella septempunctata]|uniref:cytochrome P450 18a1 n=1 Tax=Coccinella septempunctata TaxID=41139 RepID=UPI001D06ECB2|nr:cytochrome P450 18a1 [Coccinella septempunctata]
MLIFDSARRVLWEIQQGDVSTILLVFFSVLVLVRLLQKFREFISLPPGPWGLPIVGCLYFLKKDLHIHYRDLAKKYGSLYSTRFGSHLIVVLSDHKMIRELFRREEFTGRPITEFTKILGGYGLINTAGKLWKDQRKFVHEGLRHFGMSYLGSKKAQMETRITNEVQEFLSVLKTKRGEKVDLNPYFAVSISNVICEILMSVRFSFDDKRFRRFMQLIDEGFKLFGSLDKAAYIPIMRFLPGNWKTLNQIKQNRNEMGEFLQETIDEHRRTFKNDQIRDILDTYLLEIERAQEQGTGHCLFEGKDHDRQVQQILGDLFTAGMETIKSSLQWAVLFMLHHPDLMKAVKEELDEVVGRDRLPRLEDMPYLPVTESTILEVLRRSSIVPLGTAHAPTRDIKLNGFHLPKHVQVIPLLHAVHMDPNLWDDPERFNPSRFINAEGKVVRPEFFLPFGVGRRVCLGEILARMELFLFFSNFMHTFDVSTPADETLPSLTGIAGVTISPNQYNVMLEPRPNGWDKPSTSIRSTGSH